MTICSLVCGTSWLRLAVAVGHLESSVRVAAAQHGPLLRRQRPRHACAPGTERFGQTRDPPGAVEQGGDVAVALNVLHPAGNIELVVVSAGRGTAFVWRLWRILHKRHSKAMHLYEANIPLPYIRDILGHVDLSTTETYARASTEAKRKALEAAYTDIVTEDLPEWNQDLGLLDWLATL